MSSSPAESYTEKIVHGIRNEVQDLDFEETEAKLAVSNQMTQNKMMESRSDLSVKRSYCNVFFAVSVMFLANSGYFVLAGSQTSLHEVLGFVALGLQWASWVVANFLVPLIVDLIGLKLTTLLGSICYLSFTLANFYPSWYTLMPSSVLLGVGFGIVMNGTPAYVNQSAVTIAQNKPGDVEENTKQYIAIFQGVLMFSLRLGTSLANGVTTAFLLTDPVFQNSTTPVNQSRSDVCDKPITLAALSPATYYAIVGTSSLIGVFSIIFSLFLPNDLNCEFWKSKQKIIKDLKKRICSMLWMLKQPSYLLPLAGSFLSGLDVGFFTGAFTKHFVSECVGIPYVGIAFIVWATSGFLVLLVTGKITLYTTRTAAAIIVSAFHMAICLFLIFWDRQPNFVAIFLSSAVFGVTSSFWIIAPIIYCSILGSKDKLTTEVLILYWAFNSFGGACNYFISSSISIEINLWILTVVIVIALITYIIAEAIYGEKLC